LKRYEIRRRYDEIVAFSGLEDFIDTPVKRYSSGMYARLGFSVAAHVDPDILIVDEVLSVGDFAFQRKCMERMATVLKSGATVIFVSHNMEAVANLCTRSLLLERGQVVNIGASKDIVREYLGAGQPRRTVGLSLEACISSVQVRGRNGPGNHFQAGEKAYIDVEIVGREACERLAVCISISTPDAVMVFNTSSERLGEKSFSLRAGQKLACSFALDLHLSAGTYYVSASIHRYDIKKDYDQWESVQTFFVSSDRDSRGVANLYPEVSVRHADFVSGPEGMAVRQ
jgi:ABC-type methionine transport system ATPase subunit